MEKVVSKIAALGVPGLILIIATALAAIGPFGMLGGIATLGVVVLLSQGLTEFGFNAIFTAVVKELYKKGKDKKSILRKIEKYPVSKSLKRKLREQLENISYSTFPPMQMV